MKSIRRDLHKIPELGFKEYNTKEYIKNFINNRACEVFEFGETGICVFFDFKNEKTICLRAELDALPIQEKKVSDYSSLYEGRMHACGHDGHMAILLSLIDDILEKRIEVCHNVLFLFQPSEEIYGGSQIVIKNKILEKYHVDEIYALHIWPGLPKGEIFTRKKELLSEPIEFDIDIRGKNTHVATPSRGKDALYVGVELLHDIKKEIRLIDQSIFHVGEIYSYGQRNIVCDNFLCKGTIRVFSNQTKNRILAIMNRWINYYKDAFNLEINASINSFGLPLINNSELVEKSLKYGVRLLKYPYFHSEDFSIYLKQIKGAYFLLGGGNIPSLHSPEFDFDEDILIKGKELFINLIK
jgi:hippurate hydrolase